MAAKTSAVLPVPPEWRTSDVVGLCEGMRQLHNYQALPVLADALEDAGCAEPALLLALRQATDPRAAEELVARVYSEAAAAAVERVRAWAASLGPMGYPGEAWPNPVSVDQTVMTYELLMAAADAHALDGTDYFAESGGSMNWSNATVDEGYGENEFWADWALVTGRTPPKDTWEFLACDC